MSLPKRLLRCFLALHLAATAGVASPAHGQTSRAMSLECRGAAADTPANRQQADAWVRERLQAFVPRADRSLRMRSLELQAEQVRLAFYGISSTCAQYLAGTMPRQDADLALHGFEQTIANFLHDLGNDAVAVAGSGQVADMEAVRRTMTDIGAAGRQAALLGEEVLADQARQKLVDALVSFSSAFAEACYGQTFDPRIPIALQRQNDLLGTGIDVTPCANRKFTAEGKGADILWRFKHCGRGIGVWKIATEGPLRGGGDATVAPDLTGTWSLEEDAREGDVRVTYSGDLSLTLKPAAGEDDLAVADQLHLRATHSTVLADGVNVSRSLNLAGLTFVVKTSDQPCRVEDEGT
jgi:hypothetical protein